MNENVGIILNIIVPFVLIFILSCMGLKDIMSPLNLQGRPFDEDQLTYLISYEKPGFHNGHCLSVSQEFPAVSALELLVRANITVKSSIKHLVLRDAAAQVQEKNRLG